MNNNICIPANYFLILVISLMIFIYIYKFNFNKNIEYKNNNLNNNLDFLPLRQLLENRDRSILNDPIVAPERRVDIVQYPITVQNRDKSIINDLFVVPERRVDIVQYPINIPTRGYPDNYQMLGIVTRDLDEKILQLFGRATFPGSNQYEYYVTTSEFGFANKIPIGTRGGKEIMNDDIIHIPEFNKEKGEFRVKLYNYNTPRYNPYI